MSEFSDRAFVAGSLTGIRTFKVDGLGRLTGAVHTTVWTPGENIAVCRKDKAIWSMAGGMVGNISGFSISDSQFLSMFGSPAPKSAPPKEALEAKPHTVAGLGCQCGFYAYFDEFSNPYHHKDGNHIHAIVEGYGVATVGHRGFRCEKARIQGLIIKPNHDQPLLALVTRNYPDVPVFPNRKSAVARFPLTPQAPAGPDDDELFWTRSVS